MDMETRLAKKQIEKKDLIQTFKPLHDAEKKIRENEVVDLIHKLRKEWKKS